jgi:hypothetical protein
VITSGSYTLSRPFLGFRIVACTNAPRLAKLAMVQPDASGDIPSGPVSWYGVASPWALSGLGGTTMSHDTLAAAAAALAVAVADGHGAAVADAVGAAVAVVAVVAGAVAVAVAADVAAAGAVVAGVVVLVVPAAAVGGAVLSGAAVLAWVPAWAAAALGCVLVVGAAEVPAVAHPATLAVLLAAPNRLRGPMSRATPAPITNATTPAIAISLRRDRPDPQVSG